MKRLEIPTYDTKAEAFADIDTLQTYIPREDVFLSHFKTDDFITTEAIHSVIEKFSIRSTTKDLSTYSIPVMPGLEYKIGTCIFSENSKTYGLRKHIHLPKTALPTITIGKKVFLGKDDVTFNFYRRTAPPNISLSEDFVLRFDSCTLPHEIIVPDTDQSIWLFIVLEHCNDVSLEEVRDFYGCKVIYDYYG